MYIDQYNNFKVFREHTPLVREDNKLTKQGLQVDDQAENGKYTYTNTGDEVAWAYWASGQSSNPLSPPEMLHSRVIYPAEYMKKSTFEQATTARQFGSWGQCFAVSPRPEGLFPIRSQDGDIDNQYEGKELVNEESKNHKKIKNINGCHVPYGHPGTLVQCANQEEHQQLFVPSGGILSVDHQKGGFSSKVFDVDMDGWIESEKPAALDSLLRLATQKIGSEEAKTVGINLSKSGKDSTGYSPFMAKAGAKNIIALGSVEKGGPFHPGHDSLDKHKIAEIFDGDVTQPLHISTDALFYMDYNRDGKFDFEVGFCPILQEPAEIEFFAPVHVKFQESTQKWKPYVAMSTTTGALTIARVAWNYTQTGDMSEGEIVEYNSETDTYTGTKEKIWLDFEKSHGCVFETAGTNTIFRLKLIKQGFARSGEARNLYRVTHCIEDKGKYISHFGTISRDPFLVGRLLSYNNFEPIWTDPVTARIMTTIDVLEKENIFRARIPREWSFATENFNFLEVSGLPKGTKSLFRPIRPILDDPDAKRYRSFEKIGENTIAYYTRV